MTTLRRGVCDDRESWAAGTCFNKRLGLAGVRQQGPEAAWAMTNRLLVGVGRPRQQTLERKAQNRWRTRVKPGEGLCHFAGCWQLVRARMNTPTHRQLSSNLQSGQ